MINGTQTDQLEPEPPPLEKAQNRLAKACMGLGVNPASAGISGFLNSILLAARLDALAEVVLNPPNATWTLPESFEAATARHMNLKAEQLESQAAKPQIQVAGADSRLGRPNG